MLMEARQIALSDLIVACHEAADRYHDDRELFDNPELAQLFAGLAQQRRAMADDLGENARQLGILPRLPDADLEEFRSLRARVMATISGDRARTVLSERLAVERHIVELIDAALPHELPNTTRQRLVEQRNEIETAQQRLREIESRL